MVKCCPGGRRVASPILIISPPVSVPIQWCDSKTATKKVPCLSFVVSLLMIRCKTSNDDLKYKRDPHPKKSRFLHTHAFSPLGHTLGTFLCSKIFILIVSYFLLFRVHYTLEISSWIKRWDELQRDCLLASWWLVLCLLWSFQTFEVFNNPFMNSLCSI